jgi:hypothetical protein
MSSTKNHEILSFLFVPTTWLSIWIITSCLEFLMLLYHSDLSRMLYIDFEFDLTSKRHGGPGFWKSEPSSRPQSSISVSTPMANNHHFPTKRSVKRCIIFCKGVSFECFIVEGIKVCQMAGQSIGKAWQREKGESLGDALCRELACYLCAICVLAISNTIFVSLDRIRTSK